MKTYKIKDKNNIHNKIQTRKIQRQRGFLAFDFLFGFMLISSFFMLIAILSFTLSVVETLQYTAFASSRTYYASDVSKAAQRDAGVRKYQQLTESFQGLLKDDWFDVEDVEFEQKQVDGAEIGFTAKVLAFELPFDLGSTGNENTFKSSVNAYMGREKSMAECQDDLSETRVKAILELDPAYEVYGQEIEDGYSYIGDNGC